MQGYGLPLLSLEHYEAFCFPILVSFRQHKTDVQTDVHFVPIDCYLTVHNLLILPTPDVALVL